MRIRRPLESSLGLVELSARFATAKLRPFRNQNLSKIELEEIKNAKIYVSETNFEFDVVFLKICDKMLRKFDAKMDAVFDQVYN